MSKEVEKTEKKEIENKKEKMVNFRVSVVKLRTLQKILIDDDKYVSEFLRECIDIKIGEIKKDK